MTFSLLLSSDDSLSLLLFYYRGGRHKGRQPLPFPVIIEDGEREGQNKITLDNILQV